MKQTFKYYIYQGVDEDGKPYLKLQDWEYFHTGNMILISAHEVDHDVPDPNRQAECAIQLLEEKRETMRATSHAAIAEVEQQIQSLKALENLS